MTQYNYAQRQKNCQSNLFCLSYISHIYIITYNGNVPFDLHLNYLVIELAEIQCTYTGNFLIFHSMTAYISKTNQIWHEFHVIEEHFMLRPLYKAMWSSIRHYTTISAPSLHPIYPDSLGSLRYKTLHVQPSVNIY
jgi:hypothetical protein